jgi:ribosome maturation factor RimP
MDVEGIISGDYVLEVSSPGIDRPLFTLAQHAKYLGEKVKVRLGNLIEGRRRITGVLKEVTEDSILIQIEEGEIHVPFIEIERSHLTDTSYDFSDKQR